MASVAALRCPTHHLWLAMDFEHTNRLLEFGFSGGIRISALQVSCDTAPTERGVYLVVRESNQPVCFLEASTGGYFKNKNPSVPVSMLEDHWLAKPKVLYVGKAGGTANQTTIRERMRSFMQFGLGRRCAHWGGRYIWQLADAKELAVYWKPLLLEEPRQVEKALLCAFVEKYGQLPFANLKK